MAADTTKIKPPADPATPAILNDKDVPRLPRGSEWK